MDNWQQRAQGRARDWDQQRRTAGVAWVNCMKKTRLTRSKRTKIFLATGIFAGALFLAIIIFRPGFFAFFAAQSDGILHAGNWEDDPKNWDRAFNEDKPTEVKVIHSKFWRSNHFTDEHIYYFEVEATPEWRDAFLKKLGLTQVSSATARSFRTNEHLDDIPTWFAPDPVGNYDVWDQPGYFGSVWMNKTNGHFFFYDIHL